MDIRSADQNPCLVIGDAAFHRLALLLFDRTEHMVFTGANQTDEDSEFIDYVRAEIASNAADWPATTYTEVRPKVWDVKPAPGIQLQLFYPTWIYETGETPQEQPLITIGRLPLIEPRQLTNGPVSEFRNDLDAKAKLKRLRAWAHQEYNGQPASFMQGDLETRILDYRLAAKKWGLRTVGSTFTISGTDKVLSGICAGLVTALAGIPVAKAVAVGVAAAVGAAAIKIGTGRRYLAVTQSQDPVAYIAEVQRRSNAGA